MGATVVRAVGRTTKGGASRFQRFGRWLRLQLIRMVREHSTPARTGLGLALGAFIGIFPSFLVGTPIAFFVAGKLGWNRAAAVAGTFLTNPITAPLFYSLSTWLGHRIVGSGAAPEQVHGLIDNVREFGLAFLLGNTLVAAGFAALLGVSLFLFLRRHGRSGMRKMFLRSRPSYLPTPPSPPAS